MHALYLSDGVVHSFTLYIEERPPRAARIHFTCVLAAFVLFTFTTSSHLSSTNLVLTVAQALVLAYALLCRAMTPRILVWL